MSTKAEGLLMTTEQLFTAASMGVLAPWLLLAFAPVRRQPIILAARASAAILAALYTALMVTRWINGGEGADFTSLTGLSAAFAQPEIMLVGWVHYLAFDLWVGAWEADVAPKWGVPHWALLPCLALTFLFGPIGLLLFLGVGLAFRQGRRT
ncbi:ABA4-like family protein [Phenylobacterium sp.]|uniref:ABA4-like family protein n=1 Tax=Phenylobacterium sp. TaxID=1871053 RepID=UPI002734FDB2|nr:ABA4-like family protein [Phenylobacterium sp.]MDP3854305.1 ABA4-like family protein [Phenylobacterium sp.]